MKYMIFRILHFVIPLVAYYLVQFIIIYGAKFEDGAEMILDIAYWILVCIVIIGYVNLIRNYKIQTLRLPVVFYLVSQATYFVSHFVYRNDKDGDDKWTFIFWMLLNKTFYLLYLSFILVCVKNYKFYICLFSFGFILLNNTVKYVLDIYLIYSTGSYIDEQNHG